MVGLVHRFSKETLYRFKNPERVVDSQKRLSVMTNTSNEINIATARNVKPDVISGRLVRFTDLQRKPISVQESFRELQIGKPTP